MHLKVWFADHYADSSLFPLWGSTPNLQWRRLHRSVDYQKTERFCHISSPELTVEAYCIVFAPEMCRAYNVIEALMVMNYGFIINHLSDYIYGAHITSKRRHMSVMASQITSRSTFFHHLVQANQKESKKTEFHIPGLWKWVWLTFKDSLCDNEAEYVSISWRHHVENIWRYRRITVREIHHPFRLRCPFGSLPSRSHCIWRMIPYECCVARFMWPSVMSCHLYHMYNT